MRALGRRALTLGASFLLAIAPVACAHPAPKLHGTLLHGAAAELPLTTGTGQRFTLAAVRGSVVLVFFGYTHCPDICPTTLSTIASARRSMPAADAARVKVIFVGVDPARETPARVAAFAALFGGNTIGLGGTPAQLRAVEDAYHVYAAALPRKPHSQEYEVAHTSDVFVIDPAGELREILSWDAGRAVYAADSLALLHAQN